MAIGIFKWRSALVFSLLVALFLVSGCGASSPADQKHTAGTSPSSSTQASPPASQSAALTPATTAPTRLTGPINFILNRTLNFSNASGAGMANGVTHQLGAAVVERSVTSDMRHTLFKVDEHTHVTIYTNAFPPISAQVSQGADNTTTIQYTRSTKNGSTSFHATLVGAQMTATYERSSITGATVNGQTFSASSNLTATFTTQVSWVTDEQVPAAPTNGMYQLTATGGVALSWNPGTAGGTVTQYNIYRLVLTDARGFQLLTSVPAATTSYTDESAIARGNAQTITGMVYAIYAVGSSGIENPVDCQIPVSTLGPA